MRLKIDIPCIEHTYTTMLPRAKHGIPLFIIGALLLTLWAVNSNKNYTLSGTYDELSSFNQQHNSLVGGKSDKSDKSRLVNQIVTDYDENLRIQMESLVSRQVSSNDPELISLIRELMDPPSDHIPKNSRKVVSTPQSTEITRILRNKRKGFFLEVGALDGERSSNTIHLEQNNDWTGLLIEMDPYFYTQLRGKNRKAWSINACLSPTQHPTMMNYTESTGGLGKLSTGNQQRRSGQQKVPCFPLEALLLALNTTIIDYFSLDVEGFEMPILKTIPFDRLNILTFSVEYVHGIVGKQAYRDFMEAQGYVVTKDIQVKDRKISLYVDDFIFAKAFLVGNK